MVAKRGVTQLAANAKSQGTIVVQAADAMAAVTYPQKLFTSPTVLMLKRHLIAAVQKTATLKMK